MGLWDPLANQSFVVRVDPIQDLIIVLPFPSVDLLLQSIEGQRQLALKRAVGFLTLSRVVRLPRITAIHHGYKCRILLVALSSVDSHPRELSMESSAKRCGSQSELQKKLGCFYTIKITKPHNHMIYIVIMQKRMTSSIKMMILRNHAHAKKDDVINKIKNY